MSAYIREVANHEVIGSCKVPKGTKLRQSGQTACNFDDFETFEDQVCEVHAEIMNGSIESVHVHYQTSHVRAYYVNRLFSSTSVDDKEYEVGARPCMKTMGASYSFAVERFLDGLEDLVLDVELVGMTTVYDWDRLGEYPGSGSRTHMFLEG